MNRNSGVEIWDSSDPLGIERSRSCDILNRDILYYCDVKRIAFIKVCCNNWDYICNTDHILTLFFKYLIGPLLLKQSSQMLFNDICNRLIELPELKETNC